MCQLMKRTRRHDSTESLYFSHCTVNSLPCSRKARGKRWAPCLESNLDFLVHPEVFNQEVLKSLVCIQQGVHYVVGIL